MKLLPFFLALVACAFSGPLHAVHPMKGHAIWLYDATYPNGPSGEPGNIPGYWTDWLHKFNSGACEGSEIRTIFSYGGDVELYGRGAGESSTTTPLDDATVCVFYEKDAQEAAKQYKDINKVQRVMPIVDGRIDGEYLWPLNSNIDGVGQTIAKKVANLYLKDPTICGVQVDLEPFCISARGQYALYSTLNSCFQENTGSHQQYFSTFFFPSSLSDTQWEKLEQSFQGVGFVIVSGYDLGPGDAGEFHSPESYAIAFERELKIMMDKADQYHLPFMVGLPAAASTHEFEQYVKGGIESIISGYQQLDYIKAALNVADRLDLKNHEQFLGFSLWGLSTYMAYPPHSNNLFYPSIPPQEVVGYLQTRL